MRLPSGEYATDKTCSCRLPVASGPAARLLASHTLTVSSPEPLAMRLPSGEYATEVTDFVWPLPVASGPAARSLASHTLTVLSPPLAMLTMRLPSGEYATDLT